MANNRDASNIYNDLADLRTELRNLHEQGRLRMPYSWNTQWMETLPSAVR